MPQIRRYSAVGSKYCSLLYLQQFSALRLVTHHYRVGGRVIGVPPLIERWRAYIEAANGDSP